MLYVIGIFISFFLALLIFTKKGRATADLILGAWMTVIGLHITVYYAFITGQIYEYSFLLGINFILPFLHGPFLYLYTFTLTKPVKITWKNLLIHVLLPLLIFISICPFLLLPNEEKALVFRNRGAGYETYILIVNSILSISGVIYLFLNNALLQTHKQRISDQFSNQEKIDLNWLQCLFYGMALIWILIIFYGEDRFIFAAAALFVMFIGYFGIRQVGIFTNPKIIEIYSEIDQQEIDAELNIEKKKYAKSGLKEESALQLHTKLTSLMETEMLFLELELTLVDLAERLDVHPNYLSQVINEKENVNFYDYINRLRIEEFKQKIVMPENQKFTFIALAHDCGFNSKSAFNRFFKKIEGISPSEYLKKFNT